MEGVHCEKWPRRGQFLPDLKVDSPAIGQKAGEKWTGAAALQRTFLLPPTLLATLAGSTKDLGPTGFPAMKPVFFQGLACTGASASARRALIAP